jgi:hypothetical protein
MTRVRITGGFLNIGRRRPGRHPDQGLPGTEDPIDPDYGVPEGEGPEVEPPDIEPPPGIWPPPTIGHPVHPIVPPSGEHPGHLPSPPPGAIWPPVTSPVEGLFIVLAHIPDHGWKYIVIDPDAWPQPPENGDYHPEHPIAPGQPIPPREPKR